MDELVRFLSNILPQLTYLNLFLMWSAFFLGYFRILCGFPLNLYLEQSKNRTFFLVNFIGVNSFIIGVFLYLLWKLIVQF